MGPVLRCVVFVSSVSVLWVLAACSDGDNGDSPAGSTAKPAADPALLLPDVITLPASSISLQSSDGARILRFGTTLANIGAGPIEVVPDLEASCPKDQRFFTQEITIDADGDGSYTPDVDVETVRRDGECAVFHPDHEHWHIDATSRYELKNIAGETLASRPKVSFCLRDTHRVRGTEAPTGATYGECARDDVQGISPGWSDLYDFDLSGQTLRLPDSLNDGTYCLVMTADPFDYLADSDEKNNASVTPIDISGGEAKKSSSSECPAATSS